MALVDLANAALAADESTRDLTRSTRSRAAREFRSIVMFEALAIAAGDDANKPIYGPGGLLELARRIVTEGRAS